MTKLRRGLVAMVVVFSLLIQLTRLVGTASASPLSALFTGPDTSRCTQPYLFGIRPGETTVEAAAALLPVIGLSTSAGVVVVLARSTIQPTRPFASLTDVFPRKPMSAIEAQGFACPRFGEDDYEYRRFYLHPQADSRPFCSGWCRYC